MDGSSNPEFHPEEKDPEYEKIFRPSFKEIYIILPLFTGYSLKAGLSGKNDKISNRSVHDFLAQDVEDHI